MKSWTPRSGDGAGWAGTITRPRRVCSTSIEVCGSWRPRAHREKYATFSVDGTVRLVAAISDIEDVDMVDGGVRQVVVGHPLDSSDPHAKLLLGREVDRHRNPVTYISELPVGAVLTCACGCGEPVPDGRQFLPGHDQKAIHDRIKQGWGNTVGFINWFNNGGSERL